MEYSLNEQSKRKNREKSIQIYLYYCKIFRKKTSQGVIFMAIPNIIDENGQMQIMIH